MVRKSVFTREDVIQAALAVMDTEGVDHLSARRVADRMGASTAPVYSNFEKMDDLVAEAKKAAVELILEMTRREVTDNPFMNIGVGVLEFARRHPHLYSALFHQPTADCTAGPGFMKDLLERMAELPGLEALKPVERIILLRKMAIFTHGLATEICNGLPPEIQWEDLLNLLDEVGAAITNDAMARSPRSDEDLARLGSLCEIPSEPGKDAR